MVDGLELVLIQLMRRTQGSFTLIDLESEDVVFALVGTFNEGAIENFRSSPASWRQTIVQPPNVQKAGEPLRFGLCFSCRKTAHSAIGKRTPIRVF